MLRIFEVILIFIFKFNEILTKKVYRNTNGASLIFIFILCGSFLGYVIEKYLHSNIVIHIFARLMGIYIYILIPFAFLSHGEIKKYIFFGKKYYYREIINKMNILSYLFFVFWFSIILIYPIFGIPIMLDLKFVFNVKIDLVLVFILFISSIFWFAYHIVFDTVPLQIVRKELTLYIAVTSTISLLFLEEGFKVIVSCLILSYFWVQYLIESKECKINKTVIGSTGETI